MVGLVFGLFHYYSSSLNVSVQVRRLVRRNLQRLVRSHFHRLFPFISQIVFVLPSVHPVTAVQHHSFSSSNVSVHPRRTLCGVGWNALLDPFFSFFCPKGKGLADLSPCRQPPDRSDLLVRLSSLPQRQGSGDPAPCDGYPGPPCWPEYLVMISTRNRS